LPFPLLPLPSGPPGGSVAGRCSAAITWSPLPPGRRHAGAALRGDAAVASPPPGNERMLTVLAADDAALLNQALYCGLVALSASRREGGGTRSMSGKPTHSQNKAGRRRRAHRLIYTTRDDDTFSAGTRVQRGLRRRRCSGTALSLSSAPARTGRRGGRPRVRPLLPAAPAARPRPRRLGSAALSSTPGRPAGSHVASGSACLCTHCLVPTSSGRGRATTGSIAAARARTGAPPLVRRRLAGAGRGGAGRAGGRRAGHRGRVPGQ